MINEKVIQVMGDFPVKTVGFELSRLPEDVDGLDEESAKDFWDGWDYSAYTTVYREIHGGIQFSNDGSVYVEPEPMPEPEPYVPTLEEVREMKVAEMNATRQLTIDEGIDVELEDGAVGYFTLTAEERTYLMGLQSQVAAGKKELSWYTADESEDCKYYSAENITRITNAAMLFVNWHMPYFRSLRIYIRSLDSKEDVEAVTYGMEIPEEYRSEPLKAMMAAQNV